MRVAPCMTRGPGQKQVESDRRLTEQKDPFEAMSSEQLEQTVAGFLRDPLLRGMVRRSLARYEDGDRSAVADAEPDEEGGGSLH